MGSGEEVPVILESLSQELADGLLVTTLEDGRGRGVVAQRRLLRGECVLREAPLLHIVSTQHEQLEAAEDGSLEALILGRLRELSKEDADAFWALEDCRSGKDAKSAAGIFITNQMELTDIPGGDELVSEKSEDMATGGREQMKRHHGLFLLACLFNHSCAPNIFWSERASQGEIVFHMLRDAEEGEELTFAYSQAVLRMLTMLRQDLLRSLHFDCQCGVCCLSGDARSASDDRRRKLDLKMLQLGSCNETQVAHSGNEEEVRCVQRAIEAEPMQGIAIVRELCDLLDQELFGHAPTKSWACLEAFVFAESAGQVELALEFLEQGHREICVAEGDDSENSHAIGLLLSQRKGIESAVPKMAASSEDQGLRTTASSDSISRAKPRRRCKSKSKKG
jgi:hypothetical protein